MEKQPTPAQEMSPEEFSDRLISSCDIPARFLESPVQKAKRLGVPLVPAPLVDSKKPVVDPNPVVAICGKCGHECHRVEYFSCQNQPCPVQPRAQY